MRFSLLDLLCLTGVVSLFFIARETFALSPAIGPFFACLVCLYQRTRCPQASVRSTCLLGISVSGAIGVEFALEWILASFRHRSDWEWAVAFPFLVLTQAIPGGVLSYFIGKVFRGTARKRNVTIVQSTKY